MRLLFLLAAFSPALAAASAPVTSTADIDLDQARAEARAAEAERVLLEEKVAGAGSEAERLQAEQAAAAQGIAAAEAGISLAEGEVRLTAARLTELRRQLDRKERPVTALLSGIAVMGQRPPLLALADSESVDEMVRVRLLLDATLPVIRRRTGALRAELGRLQSVEAAAADARSSLARTRQQLHQRQLRFAALEAEALRSQSSLQGQAFAAADAATAAGEHVALLTRQADRAGSARAMAAQLAALGPAPLPRAAPHRPEVPFAYRLPSAAPVLVGTGAVSANGVRSRGVRLATRRGAPISAPADGIVRFSGPFEDYAGVVIIEHEDKWMSLIVNIASPLQRGTRVRLGQSLGRALSSIEVELSKDGRRVSPALIAGSSARMSNDGKGG